MAELLQVCALWQWQQQWQRQQQQEWQQHWQQRQQWQQQQQQQQWQQWQQRRQWQWRRQQQYVLNWLVWNWLMVPYLRAAFCCLPACRELCVAAASGPGLADMFGRIMVSLDEDIVSLDIPRWVAAATRALSSSHLASAHQSALPCKHYLAMCMEVQAAASSEVSCSAGAGAGVDGKQALHEHTHCNSYGHVCQV
jgi:hypothetical protein